MAAINPKYVLRNWVAETAIRAVEDQGDNAPLDRILRLLQRPYDPHPGDDAFAAPPPPNLTGFASPARPEAAVFWPKKRVVRGLPSIMVPPPWKLSKNSTASPPRST